MEKESIKELKEPYESYLNHEEKKGAAYCFDSDEYESSEHNSVIYDGTVSAKFELSSKSESLASFNNNHLITRVVSSPLVKENNIKYGREDQEINLKVKVL